MDQRRNDDRRKNERRKGGSPGGLQPGHEDLQWLRLVGLASTEPMPGLNRSRLIALGLVELKNGVLEVTERGRQALAKSP